VTCGGDIGRVSRNTGQITPDRHSQPPFPFPELPPCQLHEARIGPDTQTAAPRMRWASQAGRAAVTSNERHFGERNPILESKHADGLHIG
jgi:hypothetical protein